MKKILCVGAALSDLLLKESDEFIKEQGREKGGMVMVEKSEIDSILKTTPNQPEAAPGGSSCNTAVGLARLGGASSFLGKRGEDELGESVEAKLKEWGVDCHLRTSSDTPTGQVLSVITPDAQRTMFTFLGASASFSEGEISEADFEGMDIVHIEGYLLFNPGLMQKVIELAKKQGCAISLDLSSFEVVRAVREPLSDILKNDVDILIANEDESGEYTGKNPEESLEVFAGICDIAIVKLGADGVLIARGDERHRVECERVSAVDTTGAGDLWASGFFYGLAQGWGLDRCAKLGNQTGAAVVSVVGAVVPEESYRAIKASL